jgi:hypothetical protein
MDVRKAALKSLDKILYKNSSSDDILNYYSKQVLVASELKSLVAGVSEINLHSIIILPIFQIKS